MPKFMGKYRVISSEYIKYDDVVRSNEAVDLFLIR